MDNAKSSDPRTWHCRKKTRDGKGQMDLVRVGCFTVWPLVNSWQVPILRVKPERLTLGGERHDLLGSALLCLSSGLRVDFEWPRFLKPSVKGVGTLRE